MSKSSIKTQELRLKQNAIDRLRRSKQELEATLHIRGMRAGREFVLKCGYADAACQRRLERAIREGTQFNCFDDLSKLLDVEDGSEDDCLEIMQQPEFIEAYIKGALECFQELEEKL